MTVFLLLRVLYGVAMGGIWGVASSLAMESIPDRSRGLMSGIFQAGYPFGYLLAAVVYGLLFEVVGWRGMFVIAAPILLLPFIYFCVGRVAGVAGGTGLVKTAPLCCQF